jgi:hypothetical protein
MTSRIPDAARNRMFMTGGTVLSRYKSHSPGLALWTMMSSARLMRLSGECQAPGDVACEKGHNGISSAIIHKHDITCQYSTSTASLTSIA